MTPKIGNTPAMGEGSKRGRTPRRERQSGFQFKSDLLKKSFVDMHKTPTMLPPRNDLRRHIDTEVQEEVMEGVMDGVTEPVPAQTKPSRPKQIDPRINPKGVANWDPRVMMTPGSTMRVSAAAEVGEILPKPEAEAYQAFLNQDYLQQEAMERNIDMGELWNEMKNEFMAEYFQMPYTQKR